MQSVSKAVHKKNMFPVQRMAKIVVSRAAAILFLHFFSYFSGVGKYCPFLGKTFFLQE